MPLLWLRLISEDTKSRYPIFGRSKNVFQNSASEDCFNLIQGWLQECLSSHSQCKVESVSRLPTRVIDVGWDGAAPRLYVTRQEESQYVALSHCWGPIQIITTNKATLERRRAGIEWGDLSKTFQDAIVITRKLGQRYLWIDSLCIVQDDELDWQTESAKMAQIYLNSYFTIAATHSADGRGGCFSERVDHSEELCDGLEDEVEKHLSGIWVMPQVVNHSVLTPFDRNLEEYPLHGRAWAFQERLLARRVVQYTGSELRWKCTTGSKCECGWLDIDSKQGHGEKTLRYYYQESKTGDSYAVRRFWATTIQIFAPLQLTYESDRLPAISGVAHETKSEITGDYLAGLWERFLPELLLWWAVTGRRTKEYRAPSWSWASIETSAISFAHFIDTPVQRGSNPPDEVSVRVLEVQCKVAGADPMGYVKEGYLKISGLLLELKDAIFKQNRGSTQYYRIRGMPGDFHTDVHMEIDASKRPLEDSRSFLLKMGTFCYGPDIGSRDTIYLVLVRSERVEDAFERIGLLRHRQNEDEQFHRCAKETLVTLV